MKMKMHSVCFAALFAALSPLAHADKSITFNVPVTVEKLDPQLTGVFANCVVKGNAANPNISHLGRTNTVSPTNGSFTGVLKATINIPTADVGKVDGWICYLRFSGPGGDFFNVAAAPWSLVTPGFVDAASGKF